MAGGLVSRETGQLQLACLPARLVVLGCVAGKRRSSATGPLEGVYQSALWSKRRAYAVASGHPWAIASARHGVRWPDYPARPYELRIDQLGERSRRTMALVAAWRLAHWRAAQRRQLGLELAGRQCELLDGLAVELHAGATYAAWLGPELERFGAVVELPLPGLGIGLQLGWYCRHNG